MSDFVGFPKIARLNRDIIITEKIDGTNGQIIISDEGEIAACSRNRFLSVGSDNFGFARWVLENSVALTEILGPGRHFGEWWGAGIQRRYDQKAKRFSLFNTNKWIHVDTEIDGVIVRPVPVIYRGPWTDEGIYMPEEMLSRLQRDGSYAVPGFMKPEGIVVFHEASGVMFKATCENDEKRKTDV